MKEISGWGGIKLVLNFSQNLGLVVFYRGWAYQKRVLFSEKISADKIAENIWLAAKNYVLRKILSA